MLSHIEFAEIPLDTVLQTPRISLVVSKRYELDTNVKWIDTDIRIPAGGTDECVPEQLRPSSSRDDTDGRNGGNLG